MKKIIYLLLLPAFLSTCKSNTRQPVKDSIANTTAPDPTKELLAKFAPVIQGVWVRSDYIASLEETHSPYASSSKLGGYASLDIHMGPETGKEMHIGASLGNHEGMDLMVFLSPGHSPNSLMVHTEDYDATGKTLEMAYRINRGDTTLILYNHPGGKASDTIKYTRVLNKLVDNDMGYGINYITRKKLITGRYSLTDSTGVSIDVNFLNDGKISGLEWFKTYDVVTDFAAGPENNLDQIYFDLSSKEQKDFLFKLDQDTLNIYDSKEGADHTELEWGKLKYKLVKQKR